MCIAFMVFQLNLCLVHSSNFVNLPTIVENKSFVQNNNIYTVYICSSINKYNSYLVPSSWKSKPRPYYIPPWKSSQIYSKKKILQHKDIFRMTIFNINTVI